MEFAMSMMSFSGVAFALSAVMVSYMYMSRGKIFAMRETFETYLRNMSQVSILMTCCMVYFECLVRLLHEFRLFEGIA